MGRRQPSATTTTSHESESCNLPQTCATASTVSTVLYCTVLYLTNGTVNTHLGSTGRYVGPPQSISSSPPPFPLPAPCTAKTRFIPVRSGSDSSQTPDGRRWGVDHLGCQGGRPRPHRGQCRADHPVQDTVRPFRPTQQPFNRFPSRQSWPNVGDRFWFLASSQKSVIG